MMKKFNEFFDNDDLRNQYEIPHIKGEMPNILQKDFKKINIVDSEKETTQTFYERILFKYEVLERFHSQLHKDAMLSYATSQSPIDGITYYGQIGFYYEEGEYEICVLFRDDIDYDQDNWQMKVYVFDRIEDSYSIVEAFLNVCEKLNIIKKSDKVSVKDN